jgi:hypothetical protein
MHTQSVICDKKRKPPCEQGGHLTIACHMNKTLDFIITVTARQALLKPYFFVVSIALFVVSTVVVVSTVAGGIAEAPVVSVMVAGESVDVVDSPLLLQATNAPAIARIPRNFFMRF